MQEWKIKSILKNIRGRDSVVSIMGIVGGRGRVGPPPRAAASKRQQNEQPIVHFKLKNEFQGSKVFKHFCKIAKSDY